ncbi:hypothetical protein WMY93_022543 [Mugilogobius chulae]|uniref:Ig-like domain-containing protein n=1 Tax=Mugilogobius chulae TaxID=88201 RepID=A0AAW0NEA8_9GOBI
MSAPPSGPFSPTSWFLYKRPAFPVCRRSTNAPSADNFVSSQTMASTSTPLLYLFPVLWSAALQRDITEINSTSGCQCVLPCPSPLNSTLVRLQWVRPDLKHDGHVYDLRPSYQHPWYRGRVHLQDTHHGCDLVLTNLSTNDTGLYECFALHRGQGSNTELKSHHVIQLRVKDLPGGDNRDVRVEEERPAQREHYSLFSLGLTIPFCLLILYLYMKRRQKSLTKPKLPDPPEPSSLNYFSCPEQSFSALGE